MKANLAISAYLAGFLIVLISCQSMPTPTPSPVPLPTPTPLPPTSTQPGEVLLVRDHTGRLVYERIPDGAIVEEISYEFSGQGPSSTPKFQLRDGYFCWSFGIETDNLFELRRTQQTNTGTYETLLDQGQGSVIGRGSCSVIYDQVGGQRVSRGGDPYGDWVSEAGTYWLQIQSGGNATWNISVCTKISRENLGC